MRMQGFSLLDARVDGLVVCRSGFVRELSAGRIDILAAASANTGSDPVSLEQIHIHSQRLFIRLLEFPVIDRVVFNQVDLAGNIFAEFEQCLRMFA